MKKQNYLLLVLAIITQTKALEEFLYPVDWIMHNEQEKFCVLHQKGNHLELWFWNPADNSSIKGLLSSFVPAGLTVLPDKQGFSFIDNDRIRIKMVGKRSPKSIDLYGPYDLTTIHWIDPETFYFAAKERQHTNLFVATIHGDIFRLTISDTNEYFYPQKIDENLFFIEKDETKGYSIMVAPYPTEALKKAYQEASSLSNFRNQVKLSLEGTEIPYKAFLNLEKAEHLVTTQDMTIAFLSMHSNELGFFLEHPEKVSRSQDMMEFHYHMLYKKNENWQSKKLFSFTLPLHFLLPKRGKVRLYESILPLLPFYDGSNILYFLNYSTDADILNVFSYDISTETINQKTDGQFFGQCFFTPRIINDRAFCGGSVMTGVKKNGAPHIEIDNQGIQYFTFCEL